MKKLSDLQADGRTIKGWLKEKRAVSKVNEANDCLANGNYFQFGKSRSSRNREIGKLFSTFLASAEWGSPDEWTDQQISDIVDKAEEDVTLMKKLSDLQGDGRTIEGWLKEKRTGSKVNEANDYLANGSYFQSRKSRSSRNREIGKLFSTFLALAEWGSPDEWTDQQISDIVDKAEEDVTLMKKLSDLQGDGRTIEGWLKEKRTGSKVNEANDCLANGNFSVCQVQPSEQSGSQETFLHLPRAC